MSSKGFAKNHYISTQTKSPWKQSSEGNVYPQFTACLNEKRISFLDYSWSLHILEALPKQADNIALAICHLILAAKAGHLCVKIENDGDLHPAVPLFWDTVEGAPLHQEIISSISQGFQTLKEVIKNSDDPYQPICREGDRLYLRRHWTAEKAILQSLKKIQTLNSKNEINKTDIRTKINELKINRVVDERQAEAIALGCFSPFCIITGGPGTGKTYTAAFIIKVYLESLSDYERNRTEIAIAAPTGKAAAQLQKSIKRWSTFELPPAKTLHSLLGINRNINIDEHYKLLTADLILVDEASMIDVHLMGILLRSLKRGAKLILVGDSYQLPSVEAGSLFRDLVARRNIPVVKLENCLRIDEKSIFDFSVSINKGDAKKAIDLLNNSQSNLTYLELNENAFKAQEKVWEIINERYLLNYDDETQLDVVYDSFQRFRILTPLKKGALGTDLLNQFILSKIVATQSLRDTLVFPIMITQSDHKLGLFNGDTGILLRKKLSNGSIEEFAWFPSLGKKINPLLLTEFEYAYCLSVHKSQGSEFDEVLLILPEGSERFGREILYTAVTRAKKGLEVMTNEKILKKTISHSGIRHSGIAS